MNTAQRCAIHENSGLGAETGTSNGSPPGHPILVIAYDEKTRSALEKGMKHFGVPTIVCASFCEAENCALLEAYQGIVVDLTTMIRAKGVEKIIAHTLTGIFPTLRVNAVNIELIPIVMGGSAAQENSLSRFLTKTCAPFTPRSLRLNRRKDVCLPVVMGTQRGITVNISWSGVFIVDMNPERFAVGEELTVIFPGFGIEVDVAVMRIQEWGQQRPPGIGVKFIDMGLQLEADLSLLLRSDKNTDRDRVVA